MKSVIELIKPENANEYFRLLKLRDPEAETALYEQCRLATHKIWIRHRNAPIMEDDLRHMVFMRVWDAIHQDRIVNKNAMWAFITSTARNVLNNVRRERMYAREIPHASAHHVFDVYQSWDPLENLHEDQKSKQVAAAFSSLNEMEKLCVTMRLNGMKPKETAKMINKDHHWVAIQIHRAILKMKVSILRAEATARLKSAISSVS